ncbi:toll/interleukin-1 receptor domain-containing protein [Actinoplanes oblitus]|uniref:Toll/interleukin-1 receptor domain-containing protein n=1 Tax=Actinoplanes oblitus TaxID=3040509 RepID=A0ABY8WM87_9ACTN|nr:toll/interleukin-1 receptor domain-containing protein [Actinoplanes oblitus]WIM97947.1 toll/interleukin-1 receptor domain-containing protein [Actinoplanes oblitus]
MPILLSYATSDAPWAQWINRSLQAAGHVVEMQPAGVDFADRIGAALSGPDLVVILVSREHRASDSDWAEVPLAPGLVALLLDSGSPPAALRATNWKSLYDLDEEEALEVLMVAVGGPRNPFSRTP